MNLESRGRRLQQLKRGDCQLRYIECSPKYRIVSIEVCLLLLRGESLY